MRYGPLRGGPHAVCGAGIEGPRGSGEKDRMVFVAIAVGVLIAAVVQEVVMERVRLRRGRSLRARRTPSD